MSCRKLFKSQLARLKLKASVSHKVKRKTFTKNEILEILEYREPRKLKKKYFKAHESLEAFTARLLSRFGVNKFSKSTRHPETNARATRSTRRKKENMNDDETVIDFITILLFPMRNNSQFELHKFMENFVFCRRISFSYACTNVELYFFISSYFASWLRQLCGVQCNAKTLCNLEIADLYRLKPLSAARMALYFPFASQHFEISSFNANLCCYTFQNNFILQASYGHKA